MEFDEKYIDEIVVVAEQMDSNTTRYRAYSKMYGGYSCYGIGYTYEEAVLSFLKVKKDFEELLSRKSE